MKGMQEEYVGPSREDDGEGTGVESGRERDGVRDNLHLVPGENERVRRTKAV